MFSTDRLITGVIGRKLDENAPTIVEWSISICDAPLILFSISIFVYTVFVFEVIVSTSMECTTELYPLPWPRTRDLANVLFFCCFSLCFLTS